MIGVITLGLFVIVSSVVGLRLLWTAAHGGGAAAWTCGLHFTCIGMIAYPAVTIAGVGVLPVGEVNLALGAVGSVFMAAGVSACFFFTVMAFRRSDAWAWVLAGSSTLALTVGAFSQIGALATADPAMASGDAVRSWTHLIVGFSTLSQAWSGFEGLSEWRRARRRVALGLTDPVVANRIFLWGFNGFAMSCLNVLVVTWTLQSVNIGASLSAQLVILVFETISCITITLAFFPTEMWKNWVRARSHRAHAYARQVQGA